MSHAVLHELDREPWMVIRDAPPRPTALASSTTSELAMLERWMEGASVRALAAERPVTLRTIAKPITSAYERLGFRSRTERIHLVHPISREAG